jgi:serine protease Do/serine protease DegQ
VSQFRYANFPLWVAAAFWLAMATSATAALPAALADTHTLSLAPMIKRVSPAVVNIATRGTVTEGGPQNPLSEDPFFRRFFNTPPDLGPKDHAFQSAGSGVIFNAQLGYILTNAHVVENATEITVTLQDGRDVEAEIVGRDVPSDIAVLKVKADGLTQIPFGDSAMMEVGDFVVAIGNPFGLQHTVTSGIISGLSRSGINPDGYEDFIQTDASINPGNSGGALVNLKGELIGINTAILSKSGGNIGIGFAIPINMVKNVTDQLLKFGAVKRGVLGVNIYTLTPDIARSLGLAKVRGALVSEVVGGSAAEKAGVRTGDVITVVNGQNVKSNAELRNVIGLLRVGEKVDIGIVRDGNPQHVTAIIAAIPTPPPAAPPAVHAAAAAAPHGLDGATMTDAPDAGGALVTAIDPGSPAALQGLQEKDVIVRVNRDRVTNLEQLRTHTKSTASLVIEVRRGKASLLIPLR